MNQKPAPSLIQPRSSEPVLINRQKAIICFGMYRTSNGETLKDHNHE